MLNSFDISTAIASTYAAEEGFECGLSTSTIAYLISGFMKSFTGWTDFNYLQTCFKDTPQFEKDMCDAANAFATKDNQQVLAGLQKIMADLPQFNSYMAACPNAQADFQVVANWWTYWKGQGEMKVYQEAYKNMMNSMPTIKSDAATLSADFGANDFVGAGFEAGEIAKTVLPLPGLGAFDCELTDTVEADYLAGFIQSFTGNDHTAELEACFKPSAKFTADMCSAANAFATKDNQQVLAGLKMVKADLSEFNVSLADCQSVWPDFQVVKNWYWYWEQQGEMKIYQAAYTNVLHNMSTIKTTADKIDDDWHAGNYTAVGNDAGTIAKLALPVAPAEEVSVSTIDCELNDKVEADYLAGFIKSFTGNDHSATLETCFKPSAKFTADMCTAANAFATKDNQQVLAGIKLVRGDLSEFNVSLADCQSVWPDFQVIKNWYWYWEQQGEMKVYQSAYTNVLHNMPAIKTSASKIDDDWHANDFVAVGEDAGTIAKLALPPAAAEEYLQ